MRELFQKLRICFRLMSPCSRAPDTKSRTVPALHARRPTDSLIHHADRGSQYVSIRYTQRLAEAGVDRCVGSVGDSDDNALAETVIGLFKTEVIHRLAPWKSFAAVEHKTLEWVDWFNHQRLLEPIDDIPPAEAEANYDAALVNLELAA